MVFVRTRVALFGYGEFNWRSTFIDFLDFLAKFLSDILEFVTAELSLAPHDLKLYVIINSWIYFEIIWHLRLEQYRNAGKEIRNSFNIYTLATPYLYILICEFFETYYIRNGWTNWADILWVASPSSGDGFLAAINK